MQFAVSKQDFGGDNQSWLGSAHGVDGARTVTLDGTKFAAFKKNGSIPSGIPLKESNGKFEPVTDNGDTLAGFLLAAQEFNESGGDVVAPMLERGRVRVGRLPAGVHDVTALTKPNPLFVLVKKGSGR